MTTETTETLESAPMPAEADESAARYWTRWAPLATGLVLALPIVAFAYPPATDLALHEALVAVMRGLHDAAKYPTGLYALNLGHPNQLFHVAAYLLSFAVGTRVAVKLVLAGAVVGVAAGAARVARHLGASPWAAVAVASTALGWLLFMGLVANLLGLGLLLAALPTLDAYAHAPTLRKAGTAIAWAVVLYFAHESAMFFYAIFGGICAFAHPLRLRAFAARLAPSFVAFVIAVVQLRLEAPIIASLGRVAPPPTYMAITLKVTGVPGVLFGAYDQMLSRVLTLVLFTVVGLLATQRWREHRAARRGSPSGLTALVHAFRYELLGLASLGGYVFAPITLNGATLVYQRFLSLAVAILVLTSSPRRSDATLPRLYRAAPLLAGALPFAMLLAVLPAFPAASRNYDEVEALVPQIAPASAVAMLFDPRPPSESGFGRGPLAARAVVERGGRLSSSFAESPIAPVIMASRYDWPEPVIRLADQGNAWCPTFDFTRFRYVLFRTSDGFRQLIVTRALAPEARLVDSRGDWTLYESMLPVVPLTSPPAPLPEICKTDTLGSRFAAMGKKAREESARHEGEAAP